MELGRALLDKHGSLVSVFHAFEDGDGGIDMPPEVSDRLTGVSKAFNLALRAEVVAGLRLGSLEALVRYLRYNMVELDREVFRVFLLDGDNRLLGDQVMWTGSATKVQIHPREIARVALEAGATGVIVAHNHPSSGCRASPQDLRETGQLLRALEALEVTLHDHLIVSRDGVYSMAAAGDIARLRSASALGQVV